MKNRLSQLREAAFLILFRADFYEPGQMEEQIRSFFEGEDSFKPAEVSKIASKIMKIVALIPEIDRQLDEISEGWKTKRMSKTDLTILRLAFYEIRYDENIPVGVSINEAVELAKAYGQESSPSFVNGILARAVSRP